MSDQYRTPLKFTRYPHLLAIVIAAGLLVTTSARAQRTVEMTMGCQQNTDNGRLLVANGNMLPANARFKVEHYTPQRREAMWTYGPCVVAVTR